MRKYAQKRRNCAQNKYAHVRTSLYIGVCVCAYIMLDFFVGILQIGNIGESISVIDVSAVLIFN